MNSNDSNYMQCRSITENVTGIADSPDRQPEKFSGLRQYYVIKVCEPVKWLVDID